MVWAVLGRPFLGDPSGPSKLRKRSHAARRSNFFPPERSHAAWRSFCNFDVPCDAPCWAQRARQKRCEINAFLMIFQMKGTLGAATTWIRKSKQIKINRKNKCFSQMPWVLFGVHFRWSSFCLPILGPQDGPPSFLEISVNAMLF